MRKANEATVPAPLALVPEIRDASISHRISTASLVEAFVTRINTEWTKSIEAIIETGAALCEAKEALPHGDFTQMVEQRCHFGIRTAEALMRIAANPVLADAQHAAHLPASWTTLDLIATLDPEPIAAAIGSGAIHAKTTRREAKALVTREAETTTQGVGVPVARRSQCRTTLLDELKIYADAAIVIEHERIVDEELRAIVAAAGRLIGEQQQVVRRVIAAIESGRFGERREPKRGVWYRKREISVADDLAGLRNALLESIRGLEIASESLVAECECTGVRCA